MTNFSNFFPIAGKTRAQPQALNSDLAGSSNMQVDQDDEDQDDDNRESKRRKVTATTTFVAEAATNNTAILSAACVNIFSVTCLLAIFMHLIQPTPIKTTVTTTLTEG
jgi:hypothetical protein